MKKTVFVLMLFLVGSFSFCDEIEKSTFDNLLDVFYSRYRFCTMEITFCAERYQDMTDNRIHYNFLAPDYIDLQLSFKQMLQISKKNIVVYIKFEDETILSYHYTDQNKAEFLRNLNMTLQFLEKI